MGIPHAAETSGLVRTSAEHATLVRRTYTLVFISVLTTVVGVTYGMSNAALMNAVSQSLPLTALCVFLPLIGARIFRNRFPLNIALVFLFTFAMGVTISPAIFLYTQKQPGIVSQAAGLTLSTFAVLTLYAFLSRRNFSALGSFFTVGLWVLIGTSLLNLFFHNPTTDLWLAAGTVIIFSGLLIFDTWRLRNVYGPDDYVTAAVAIYLDLLNIFLGILRILGGRRD